ncbi:hypothetical protein F2P81_022735 [Scophthalmus maximus]|uniref:Uncharacterized protein n=1 Tax=Scophthalmus maximus TaxID=52904 RepID=A0A6A4S5P0_SCOMX|nr:hypothetical protein F2P81_022735 [Scophthalmus maximus]
MRHKGFQLPLKPEEEDDICQDDVRPLPENKELRFCLCTEGGQHLLCVYDASPSPSNTSTLRDTSRCKQFAKTQSLKRVRNKAHVTYRRGLRKMAY